MSKFAGCNTPSPLLPTTILKSILWTSCVKEMRPKKPNYPILKYIQAKFRSKQWPRKQPNPDVKDGCTLDVTSKFQLQLARRFCCNLSSFIHIFRRHAYDFQEIGIIQGLKEIWIRDFFTMISSTLIEWSVYMTSLWTVKGTVSFNLDAMNMHTAPNSCNSLFLMSITLRNLSM